MVTRRLLAASLVLAGCTDEVVVAPVIELPVDDDDAAPFTDLDEITLGVAHDGDERDLVTQRFKRGAPLELAGVPFGTDLVVHMAGYDELSASAYGRTCGFAIDPDAPVAQPHLFFSRSLRFARTGIESITRTGGRAVSLDGAAILIGGTVRGNPVLDVERFDPRTGALTTIGTVTERIGAVEALLGTSPQRVVIIGGRVGTTGASFYEVIDPERSVDRIDDIYMARVGLTATRLTDGRVVAIGGSPPGMAPVGTITGVVAEGAGIRSRIFACSSRTHGRGIRRRASARTSARPS